MNFRKKLSSFILLTCLMFTFIFSLNVKADTASIQAKSSINSVQVTSDKNNIQVVADSSGDMSGTDGNFYLFELKSYNMSLEGRSDYLSKIPAGKSTTTVSLERGTANDRLYSAFVVAVHDGTKYVAVSEPHYVTNPEAVAQNTAAFNEPLTKKGLNIESICLQMHLNLELSMWQPILPFIRLWERELTILMTEKLIVLVRL